jgi:iron complex transport system substrate-binding protein
VEAGVDPGPIVVDPVEEPEDQRVDVARRLPHDPANVVREVSDLLVEIEDGERLDDLLSDGPLGPDADRTPAGRRGVRLLRDGDDVVEEGVVVEERGHGVGEEDTAERRGNVRVVLRRVAVRVLLAAVLVVLAAACKRDGRRATADPELRIVSLSPSTTEAVFAVGIGNRLVGRSRYCNFPPEVLTLPQVGGYVDPSFEAILALRPTLVIGARGPAGSAIAERLEARGIATYFPETESFGAIDTMIRGVADRARAHEAGVAATNELRARVERIEHAVASLAHPRVLLVFGLSPISVAGPSSFADEMIRRAGGTNVVASGGAYPTISAEEVLRLDPDVVVNAAMMEERASERLRKDAPGWDHVRAVANDRVASITDEAVLRPGPRIPEGLALLARALHPEAKLDLEGGAPR